MLNPFPELLSYGFLAPTLIRLGLSVVFLIHVLIHLRRRGVLTNALTTTLRSLAPITFFFLVALELVLATTLFFGIQTQLAAILSAVFSVILWRASEKNPVVGPAGRLSYLLIFFMSLALILTGAGALAIDIPL